MHKDMEVIKNKKELLRFFSEKQIKDFIFEFEELDAIQTQKWIEKIKKDYLACGCDTGALFLILSLLTIIIFFSIKWLKDLPCLTSTNVLYSILLLFLAAGIGKIVGLIIAKHRLKKNLKQLATIIL